MSNTVLLMIPVLIGVGLTIGRYYKAKIERQSKRGGSIVTFDSLIAEVKTQLGELQKDSNVDFFSKEEYDIARVRRVKLSRALEGYTYPEVKMQEASIIKNSKAVTLTRIEDMV